MKRNTAAGRRQIERQAHYLSSMYSVCRVGLCWAWHRGRGGIQQPTQKKWPGKEKNLEPQTSMTRSRRSNHQSTIKAGSTRHSAKNKCQASTRANMPRGRRRGPFFCCLLLFFISLRLSLFPNVLLSGKYIKEVPDLR